MCVNSRASSLVTSRPSTSRSRLPSTTRMVLSRFTSSAALRSSSSSGIIFCLGPLGGFPAGERIGEVHAYALVKLLRERRADRLQQQSELKVRNDKRGGQKLESKD